MQVPALPARLWAEGSEIMMFDARQRQREMSLECFPGGFPPSLPVMLIRMWSWRIQHANVIFAFQRYLRGYMFILWAAEQEVSQADVNHRKFP